jgi:hypothetical protein
MSCICARCLSEPWSMVCRIVLDWNSIQTMKTGADVGDVACPVLAENSSGEMFEYYLDLSSRHLAQVSCSLPSSRLEQFPS